MHILQGKTSKGIATLPVEALIYNEPPDPSQAVPLTL